VGHLTSEMSLTETSSRHNYVAEALASASRTAETALDSGPTRTPCTVHATTASLSDQPALGLWVLPYLIFPPVLWLMTWTAFMTGCLNPLENRSLACALVWLMLWSVVLAVVWAGVVCGTLAGLCSQAVAGANRLFSSYGVHKCVWGATIDQTEGCLVEHDVISRNKGTGCTSVIACCGWGSLAICQFCHQKNQVMCMVVVIQHLYLLFSRDSKLWVPHGSELTAKCLCMGDWAWIWLLILSGNLGVVVYQNCVKM